MYDFSLKLLLLFKQSSSFTGFLLSLTALVGVLSTKPVLPANPGPPFRGSVGWSFLLCTYTDAPKPSRNRNFFRDMFIRQGTGGLADYWNSISYGAINLDNSFVTDWYTVPMTVEEAKARDRNSKFNDCRNAASNSGVNPYTPPSDHLVATITSPFVDLFGNPGVGAFWYEGHDLVLAGHEMAHGWGLEHSFSNDPTYRNADWAKIGEYDDQWDLMSAGNVFATPTDHFGNGGPGLNAYHRDQMGWIPRDRIMTFGADGTLFNGSVTLTALNHPETPGTLLIRIPFDPNDPFHYYTVEFRRKNNWDAGIPEDTILIHEVKKDEEGVYRSYLLKDLSLPEKPPLQTLQINDSPYLSGVTIQKSSSSTSPNQVTLSIGSTIVERCLPGYVWREANQNDKVCVTPEIRQQTREENSLADLRRSPTGGAFGPDTCKQGYVWREAFRDDHVCVSPSSREQARSDNQQVVVRRNPARFVYGPNTCKQGYVWREADVRDWVCVTPEIRQQTRKENSLADSRRSPTGGAFGPDTCKQGYVWREAFPGDHICVSPSSTEQARSSNQQARNRLMILSATGGTALGGLGKSQHNGHPENTFGNPTDFVLENLYSGINPYVPSDNVPNDNVPTVPEPSPIRGLGILGIGGIALRLLCSLRINLR
jgi:hypothetical protein